MDFSRSHRRKPFSQPAVTQSLESLCGKDSFTYRLPPTDTLTIQEFEKLGLGRLKILKKFELAKWSSYKVGSEEWFKFVQQDSSLSEDFLKAHWENDLAARRRDHISHFILRLVFCKTHDERRWFIQRETELFYFKYGSNPMHEHIVNNFSFILDSPTNLPREFGDFGENLQYYQMSFQDVPSLVQHRKCILYKGVAFITEEQLIDILAEMHQSEMEYGLVAAANYLLEIKKDERVEVLMNNLSGANRSTIAKKGEVDIEDLDQLSMQSFPLCMRNLHEHLREHHHLKWDGRNQYGLFLKGIGVSMKDSLTFWEKEFTKKMDLETYTKQKYAYKIRHNFGMEGSQINYKPFSCSAILHMSVGLGQKHGCPFKNYSADEFRKYLRTCGITSSETDTIVHSAQEANYQRACSAFFEAQHCATLETPITHPNQYFELSQKALAADVPEPTQSMTEHSISEI